MDNINEVISKLHNLKLEQQQLVAKLITEISASNQDYKAPSNRKRNDRNKSKRYENPHFISSNGVALAIGDKVRVFSNRKTGRYGDLAKVTQFNRTYVAIQLDRNKSNTQRAAKYLEHITDNDNKE